MFIHGLVIGITGTLDYIYVLHKLFRCFTFPVGANIVSIEAIEDLLALLLHVNHLGQTAVRVRQLIRWHAVRAWHP